MEPSIYVISSEDPIDSAFVEIHTKEFEKQHEWSANVAMRYISD